MYEIIKNADKYIPRIYSNTREFISTIEELKNLDVPVSELITETLNRTGYTQSLKNENTVEAESRIQNLEEFLTVAEEFEKESADKSLTEFLNGISLASDTDSLEDTDNVVTLMTLHSAKGLEYPTIFLVGLEEGIFPGYQSMDNPADIEEERRLFYVGITRAKQHLFMTFARRRTIFGSTSYNPPSRFLKEIPKDILDGYEDAMQEKSLADEFEDVALQWNYGRKRDAYSLKNKITTYKVDDSYLKENKVANFEDKDSYLKENKTSSTSFGRTAESFLASLQAKKTTSTDISKYEVGQRVFHKKFGEGVITKLEPEDDDIKVDLDFEKAGHKRLMAKFAGLEILS